MDRLVGIIRTAGTLTAQQVRRSRIVDFGDCNAVLDAFSEANAPWYEFADSLLGAAQHPALLADWNALSCASTPDAEAVQRVLAETVLGQAAPNALPPVAAPAQPAPIKPTAAHPRAYSGTKFKPPTPKSPALKDWRPLLCDPRRQESVAAEARLPSTFRVSLYPLIKGQDTEIADLLALYWALGLDSSPERLAAAAYLFSLQNFQNSRNWCRLIVGLPPEQWTLLLTLVIESGVSAIEVPPPSFAETLAEVLNGEDAPYRAYWLLHGLTVQIDPAYLLAGYRLADVYEKKSSFHTVRRSGYFPLATVLRWGDYCREVDDFYPGVLLSFWEECGLRDGLGEYFEQVDYMQMTPDAAHGWLRLLNNSWSGWNDLTDDEANAKWAAVQPWLEPMMTLVQEVSAAYQDKCVRHLREYIWQCDTQEEMQTHLPAAFTLIRRLCCPPFAENNDPDGIIADFLTNLSLLLRERFLSAPDTSFKRLEQSCRRDNDARLIGYGIEAVTRHQSEFSVLCFENDPTRLFHAAKRLGVLPKPMRDAVVQAFTALPDETPRVALARLEDAVTKMLASGFPPDIRPHAEIHALQMQQLVRDNRKVLRKLLTAHWEGRTDYRQTHPLTRRWLTAHPALDLEKWQVGVIVEAEHERGLLTLAIEQDPLEALKLGTYVGSCLGLGGAFTYSAAAVVLDINKQVVYARDKRGSVVARQLVAISEADQLVCYSVYPLNAQKDLGVAFREFDMHLASALGLPIYQYTESEDYDIAHILSHDWWDDFAWDLTTETDG